MLPLKEKSFTIKNMEDTAKIFMAGLKKWARIHKINQTEIGRVIKRDQTTISLYYQGSIRPSPESITLWIDHYNLDHEKILEVGRQELHKREPQPSLDIDEIADKVAERLKASQATDNRLLGSKLTDIDIIQRFRNKPLAAEITQNLLKLEGVDPAELEEINALIKLKLEKHHNKAKEPAGSGAPGGEKPNGTTGK